MASPISTKFYSIVAGAGAGTGRAIALKFAKTYPVILLSRTPATSIQEEIHSQGGEAHTISTDVSDERSVKNAFSEIKQKMGEKSLACATFNVGGRFGKMDFLDTGVEQWMGNIETQGKGFFLFSQSALPLLLSTAALSPPHPPTLLCTGATASMRGSAGFSAISAGCFAMRSTAQSIAREFGPKGVHVAHLVVDGVIDTPGTKKWTVNGGVEDSKVDPAAIAETYWSLHTQGKGGWTMEAEVRPWVEKF